MPVVDRAAIADTHALIAPYLRDTPVVDGEGAEWGLPDVRLAFKLEQLQHSGSFKVRGAFANLLLRPPPKAGVVAASGGNHGAAVAYAAGRLGVPATIFVPGVCSPTNQARIRGYGADLRVTGERYDDALKASADFAAASGALPVHAFDQEETILGAGTVGRDFEAQATGGLDTMLVAVGGGGLIAGVASWFAGTVAVVGVEPEGAPTLTRAWEAGRPVDAPAGSVAVESLAPKRVGERVYPLTRRWVSRLLLVTDDAILEAQALLWDRLRVVAEPGGATALAALLSDRYRPRPGERVGVLVCGANTDLRFAPTPKETS